MNNKIIANRDIIIVGLQPWDTAIGSNCKDLALEFSKNNRVLYVNSPLDINTIFSGRNEALVKKRINYLRGKKDNLQALTDNLWVYYPDTILLSINWVSNHSIFKFLNRLNNKLLSRSIKKAMLKLNFSNIILFNDNDIFRGFYLKELLPAHTSVYYSRDFLLAVYYWKKHGISLEPKLIEKSDVCVANSTYLADYCKKYNTNSFYVGQGCDLTLYAESNAGEFRPADIRNLKYPIVGYTGFLTTLRLDLQILLNITETRPDWNFVLVGPEDDDFKRSILHQRKNVHFLGAKKPEQLPAYIAAFDVCINPQIVNEVTIGNYPRKVDEYLAMGKPVVATNTPAMSIFKKHVYLAEKDDYIGLIEIALTKNNDEAKEKRKAFAGLHTWENNTNEIYKAINYVEGKLSAKDNL